MRGSAATERPDSRSPRAVAGRWRAVAAAGAALLIAGCSFGAPTGSWSHEDGAQVTVVGGRVTFEDLPFYDTSVSCEEPVQTVSGEGRNTGNEAFMDVQLDDPIDLGPEGLSQRMNLVFVATGPGWDPWQEIGIGGCDFDAPIFLLQRTE